ncbi:ATP-binding protein [Mesorhizobium tianshanense]|uniref:C4-dicarboxylate transport sensor protein DctB n=1 Tax=Mesorhizobium tianshanense TaxID=39844 RepID=A0A562PC27_9HYPH|nr:ATP-binding protein [Mesorhizobium tianshanense]TWI41958.1 two-component system C4-dicarboxylate transport sensor histidine kinase DctB [Mesorhizobium tianshanense]
MEAVIPAGAKQWAAEPEGTWRFGIGARLVTAFVVIVGLAVGACLVGWLSYVRLAGELSQIAQAHMPQLAFATRLSKAGADINAVMASLAGAQTRGAYTEIRRSYSERLEALQMLLDGAGSNSVGNDLLLPLADAVHRNLEQIDLAAGKRFTLVEEMRSAVDELRWVQADLLEEADPLVEDVRFNMETEADQTGFNRGVLLEEQRKSEALLTVVSQANLATGLIGRLVNIGTLEDLQETNAFLGDSADDLAIRIRSLSDWPDSITVRQLAERVLKQSDVHTGIPNLKRSEMAEASRLETLAAENRRLVQDLGARIEAEVIATEARAAEASARAETAIATGRKLLVAIAILAVTLAIVIGYFYVHRNLLARIRLLANVAGNISAGRSGTAIPSGGRDELGDLARALNIFRQTRDELIQSAKLAALGQMAAGIGHELNQPLAAIRSHSHNGMLLIERGQEDQAFRNLDKIKSLATRMGEQISHLRRFARRPDSHLGPVELGAIVEDALSLLDHRFDEEGVELDLALPKESKLQVLAEPVRLEQVAVNLIANALDAVAGREVRRVSIRAWAEGTKGFLLVGDSGPGIAPGDLDSIFDPFFTTKSAGSGLGLGLSISYNIIKDFNGTISVKDTGPTGTRFLVSLDEAHR